MFIKGKEKWTLEENFLESINVEKVLAVISSHQGNEDNNPFSSKKSVKKNKGISNTDSNKGEGNEIIDLKKNKGEGEKPFKPFLKKKTDSTPQIPPTSGINLEYYQWKIIVIQIMIEPL